MSEKMIDDLIQELTVMFIKEHEKKDSVILKLKKEDLLKSYIKLIKLIKKYKY